MISHGLMACYPWYHQNGIFHLDPQAHRFKPCVAAKRLGGRAATRLGGRAATPAQRARRERLCGVITSKFQFPWEVQESRGSAPKASSSRGPTNEIVRVVNGIRHKRLGGSDVVVSEVGLGTQRWGSADFNGPERDLCHDFMDRAILDGGVNFLDTAEQYPIPSDRARPEGLTEKIIGSWIAKDTSRRSK
ncbi:hypothetical protein CYMTET_13397, partial [Cymbomonas tetramitiformis]